MAGRATTSDQEAQRYSYYIRECDVAEYLDYRLIDLSQAV
jgi:hypothetical protein